MPNLVNIRNKRDSKFRSRHCHYMPNKYTELFELKINIRSAVFNLLLKE